MQPVVLDFAGTKVAATCGETVAAALTRAGIRALRRDPDRGVFCGMGVCQDCVVAIDGVPARACMTTVTGPHRIGVACPPPPAPPPPIELADIPVLTPDVLVVGGGGAGLSAATAAARAGASVVLLDERSRPGGQYFKQPAPGLNPADDRRFAAGRRLLARARQAGVQLLPEATVWAAVPPRDIAVLTPSGLAIYRPAALVVATGAYERARPIPGWTLPGVMTTGAAQTLLRGEGVAPGRRVLVCGHGPLNLQVAVDLARSGAQVVAVVEQAPRPGLRHAAALWRMATSAPALLARGAALLRDLHRRGVKVLHGHMLAAVRKLPDGLQAELAGPSGPTFDVDVVCMGYGFQPANEILRALDCRHRFDPARSQLMTERDRDGATSVTGVYAAGDCCGLGGAHAAVADGRIAGAAASRHAGRSAQPDATARRLLARHRRFQDGLWRLYAAPDTATALATPDTIVCRCEGVTMATIQAAIDGDAPGIGAVKRLTRAGMGACQGRYCAPVLAALLARRSGVPIDALSFLAPRAPIKPVSIAALSRP